MRDQNSTDQDRTKENSQNFTLPTSIKMIDWEHIDTVLLDMDGVLLDLRFDNWFWLEHVPAQYAAKQGLSLEDAKFELFPKMLAVQGTLQWYCVEYWSHTLELDIIELKVNNAHRISVRPLVVEFLTACLKKRKPYLVTNAHRDTIDIKLKQACLDGFFEEVICSHEYGAPKEELAFWHDMSSRHEFDPKKALFIDDNLSVLRTAREFGINYLIAIHQPDSGQPGKEVDEFAAIHSFDEIMPR